MLAGNSFFDDGIDSNHNVPSDYDERTTYIDASGYHPD